MKYELFPPLAIHDIGQRPNQEDAVYPSLGSANKNDRLFILCDGMGGHMNGEVASNLVCSELSEFVKTKTNSSEVFSDMMMTRAMSAVYNKLNALDKETVDDDRNKMGTTMVMLYFHAGGLMAAHIGDSRYYHIRPKNREIIYRSKDHSLVNDLYDAGEITLGETKTMKGKNIVMRVIMPHQEQPAMPDIVHIKDIRPGDWFYMCSDGMLENMDDEELLNILCNESLTDSQKRDCLVAATNNNKDNHSAYLIHIGSVVHEIIDENEPDDEMVAISNNKLFHDKKNNITEVIVEAFPQTQQPIQRQTAQVRRTEKANNVDAFRKNSDNKNNKLFLLLTIAAIAVCIIVYLFSNTNKSATQPKQSPSEIRYEEYPSGKTISRDRQEVSEPASPTQSNGQKKNVNSNNKITNVEPTPAVAPAAGETGNSVKDNTNDGMIQGLKAVGESNKENKDNKEAEIRSIPASALGTGEPKEQDKDNPENKKGGND